VQAFCTSATHRAVVPCDSTAFLFKDARTGVRGYTGKGKNRKQHCQLPTGRTSHTVVRNLYTAFKRLLLLFVIDVYFNLIVL